MPFNFDYCPSSSPVVSNNVALSKQVKHTGEFRDCTLPTRSYYCSIAGTDSENDGVVCTHGAVITQSHWSCCGNLQMNSSCAPCTPESTRQHSFISKDSCRICWKCSTCSGFGQECCKVQNINRSGDKGMPCGCGVGDSLCLQCGLCRGCIKHSTSDSVPDKKHMCSGPLHLTPGTKVFSEWKKVGGSIYPGLITESRVNPLTGLGSYDVHYDDGDQDHNVAPIRVHLQPPTPPVASKVSSLRLEQLMSALCSDSLLGDSTTLSFLLSQKRGIRDCLVPSNPIVSSAAVESEMTPRPPSKAERKQGPPHSGQMACNCLHQAGNQSWPLDMSLVHLAPRCRWSCCHQAFNDMSPCPMMTSHEVEAALQEQAYRQGASFGAPSVPAAEYSPYEVVSANDIIDQLASKVLLPCFVSNNDDRILTRKRGLFSDF